MQPEGVSKFQEVLEKINELSLEDQEFLLEIAYKRIIEKRREEILKNAEETLKAFRKGKSSKGAIQDLIRDLEGTS